MVFRILLFDLARLDFVGPARISSGGTCSARLTDRDIMEATTLSLQDSGLTSKPGGKLISNEKGSSEAVDAAVTAVAGSDRTDFLRDKSLFDLVVPSLDYYPRHQEEEKMMDALASWLPNLGFLCLISRPHGHGHRCRPPTTNHVG